MVTATRRLGLMTARALRLMTDSVVIVRKISSQDSSGGEVDTLVNFGPFPCRLNVKRVTPLERVEGGRLEAISLYTAYLPHSTDVRPADQLVITESDSGRVTTYEVGDTDDRGTDGPFMAVSLRLVH